MKKVKINRRVVRKSVISRLKDCNLHRPSDPMARKFLNDLLDIPLNPKILKIVLNTAKEEDLPDKRQDVINKLYYSNATAGMVIFNEGKNTASFLRDVYQRFSTGGAISG